MGKNQYNFVQLASAFVDKSFMRVFSRMGDSQIDWNISEIDFTDRSASFLVLISRISNVSLDINLSQNQCSSLPNSITSQLSESNELMVKCDASCSLELKIDVEIDDSYLPNGALVFSKGIPDIRKEINKTDFHFFIRNAYSNFNEINDLSKYEDVIHEDLVISMKQYLFSKIRLKKLIDSVAPIPEMIVEPVDQFTIKKIMRKINQYSTSVDHLLRLVNQYKEMEIVHFDLDTFSEAVDVHTINSKLISALSEIINLSDVIMKSIMQIRNYALRSFVHKYLEVNLESLASTATILKEQADEFLDISSNLGYREVNKKGHEILDVLIYHTNNLIPSINAIEKFNKLAGDLI